MARRPRTTPAPERHPGQPRARLPHALLGATAVAGALFAGPAAAAAETPVQARTTQGGQAGTLQRLQADTAQESPPAPQAALRSALRRLMRGAGRGSGAYVRDVTNGRTLFGLRSRTRRVLASNTKLFTTYAALDRLGADARLETSVLGAGSLAPEGTWTGDLVLRGGGDPTFGSAGFARRHYGGGATVDELADEVAAAGVTRVSGRVLGDESAFDSRRGGPYSGYGVSGYVGPLSGLAYNRGLANEFGSAFQSNPPVFAAGRLTDALEARGIDVQGAPRAGSAPAQSPELADAQSPAMRRLIQITNKRSDNFFAEMLLKDVGRDADGVGTTDGGARAAVAAAGRLDVPAALADGSGLSRRNAASPAAVTRLLERVRAREEFAALFDSLAIAGRDGTLSTRMRSGPARGRCRGKTGTLSNVSALSGYCTTRAGTMVAFSILMNGVSPPGARRVQDRMAQALAGFRG